jgi:hypothetical protein
MRCMAARRSGSLLRPHDPRWETLNRAQDAEAAARARVLSVAERLDRGVQLSHAAADLRRAAWKARRGRPASRHGLIDLLREGPPRLDFDTVAGSAIDLTYHDQPAKVASLESLVALKRLADRPRDRHDLSELERIHGPLPRAPLPGLDR